MKTKKNEIANITVSGSRVGVTREQVIDFLMPALAGREISETEKDLAIQQAVAMNLNPAKREVYFIPHRNKKTGKTSITLITSYEVYCKRAQPYLDGMEIYFDGDKKSLTGQVIGVNENPKFIYIKIWKKGSKKPFEFTFTKQQLAQGRDKKGGDWDNFWILDPRTMMMKTAIVRAFRIVFPDINLPYASEEIVGKDITQIKEEDLKDIDIIDTNDAEETQNTNPLTEKFYQTLKEYCETNNRKEDFVINNIIKRINTERKDREEEEITTIEEATAEEIEIILQELEKNIKK